MFRVNPSGSVPEVKAAGVGACAATVSTVISESIDSQCCARQVTTEAVKRRSRVKSTHLRLSRRAKQNNVIFKLNLKAKKKKKSGNPANFLPWVFHP